MSAEIGLFLDGLRCSGCVSKAEKMLRSTPGVERADVNYTTHRALVRYVPGQTEVAELVAGIQELGFEATPYDPDALDRPHQQQARAAMSRLLVAAFLAGNVMWIAIALYIGAFQGVDPETRRLLRWVGVALSAPAVTWCAWPFWRGAWIGLRHRSLTIDVPIVLGMATAFGTNVAGTLAETEHLFVDSAAMIVFLILLGRTLEKGARARASSAVDRLTALTPPLATRIRSNQREQVPVSELEAGDRVLVAPGETVPVDGWIRAGESEFDESLLTGESQPVARMRGEAVTGGTDNLLAEIEVEVRHGIAEGTLAKLASLLERAQTERPQVQRLADRVAAVFAPVVLGVAAMTALGWWIVGASGFEIALAASSVLIVACPCALGLATPAAVTAAIGRAASLGILVKSGEALERCAQVDLAVLDKTGTLTEGRLQIASIELGSCSSVVDTDELIELAVYAEGESLHPLATSLRSEAELRGIDLASASETECRREIRAGAGVECQGDRGTIRVGSRAWMESVGVSIDPDLSARADKLALDGQSLAWVSRNEIALGVIGMVDAPRVDARETVTRLAQLGVAVELVTGDHRDAADRAALTTGITTLSHDVSPQGKIQIVRDRRSAGRRVVVVGDGVNDAAALAAADVGIAMTSGSDVTLHAADLAIRGNRLSAVADAIGLSRATFARIRENLGFALLYNIVAVPLAAGGVLHPLWAAIAMSASSLVVTGNAIRLLRWRATQ